MFIWYSLTNFFIALTYEHTQGVLGSAGLAKLSYLAMILRSHSWRCANDVVQDLNPLAEGVLMMWFRTLIHCADSKN